MNIVVEGPDGSGKSTLVDVLAHSLNMQVIHSEGPVRDPAAMHRRCTAFLSARNTIFDRHCIVSERVYGTARGNVMLDPVLENMFYVENPLIIYCRSVHGLSQHVRKEHDTDDHLIFLSARHKQICDLYDRWALHRAHVVYRMGDDHRRILKIAQELCK